MKRLEPNLLLAVATGTALTLLVVTSVVFGPPGGAVKFPLIAVISAALFLVLNGLWVRRRHRKPAPMIRPQAATSTAWAALLPMAITLAAAIPVFWPGHDYGVLVIAGGIWFGLTLQSAIAVRRA